MYTEKPVIDIYFVEFLINRICDLPHQFVTYSILERKLDPIN
jgi:hypothetical protein